MMYYDNWNQGSSGIRSKFPLRRHDDPWAVARRQIELERAKKYNVDRRYDALVDRRMGTKI